MKYLFSFLILLLISIAIYLIFGWISPYSLLVILFIFSFFSVVILRYYIGGKHKMLLAFLPVLLFLPGLFFFGEDTGLKIFYAGLVAVIFYWIIKFFTNKFKKKPV